MEDPSSPQTLGSERRAYATRSDRLRSIRPLVLAWLGGAMIMAGVGIQDGLPVRDLFMDATYLGGRRWYVGMVAALGVLAWTVSVCGCAAASFVSRLGGRDNAASAFRGGAMLFTLLLLDDLFLFHATLLPYTVGIPKPIVLGVYGGLGLAWVATAKSEIMRTRWELLAAASLAFGMSLAVEAFWYGDDVGARVVAEDGAKFMGVLALAAWSVSSASDLIRSVVTTNRTTSDQSHTNHSVK